MEDRFKPTEVLAADPEGVATIEFVPNDEPSFVSPENPEDEPEDGAVEAAEVWSVNLLSPRELVAVKSFEKTSVATDRATDLIADILSEEALFTFDNRFDIADPESLGPIEVSAVFRILGAGTLSFFI
jgi:hypothetical protein